MNRLTLKTLPEEELFSKGSNACAGCGALLAARLALKVLGENTIFINSTGCLAVIMQMGVPKVPHFHVLFENGPAVASGIDAALEAQGRREGVNLLVMAGDGATADIGLSALSGAVERGHRLIYICYDNESYMNTGGQRSGTTPLGAATTTTPATPLVPGEERPMELQKDVAEMMLAQGCPYVATASLAYPVDYINKVKRASEVNGPSYIQVHSFCPPGWGIDPADGIRIERLLVQSGYWVLYEYERGTGKRRVTVPVRERVPIAEYLKSQKRFAHILDRPEIVGRLQAAVDERFKRIMAAAAE